MDFKRQTLIAFVSLCVVFFVTFVFFSLSLLSVIIFANRFDKVLPKSDKYAVVAVAVAAVSHGVEHAERACVWDAVHRDESTENAIL